MSESLLLLVRILLAAALYAFLGWALWVIWQELRRQSQLVQAPHAPPIQLVPAPEVGQERYQFQTPEVTVGRDPASSLHLEDKTISAQHARLVYRQGHWWVEDLKSTNGTFLNQEAVALPMVLTAGDEVRFGQVSFEIVFGNNGSTDE